MKKVLLMIGPDPSVKGGIASVVKGYLNSNLTTIYNLKYISTHKDGTKFVKAYIALIGFIKIVYNIIFMKPDIVHIHTSFGASFYRKSIVIMICERFKISTINHIHGAEFDRFYTKANHKKKKFITRIYDKCDYTIVLSDEWKDKIENITEKTNIRVINNYALIPDNIGEYEDKENIVLFLGEIGERKGAFDIPSIVEKVVSEVNNIKFYICGNGEHKKIENMIQIKDINKFIITKDWVDEDEKKVLLKKAKIYFLPSYNEGLPMSILEGMSYGLPIVSTKVGGIPTLVEDGENGFLNNPGDVKKLANSIISIINDKRIQLNMRENNYNKIKSKYSLEAHLDKLKNIYSEII